MFQVPRPSAATLSPDGSCTCFMGNGVLPPADNRAIAAASLPPMTQALDDPLHDREVGARDSTLDTTRIDDVRIGAVRPLITPALLQERVPVRDDTLALVEAQPRRDRRGAARPRRPAGRRRRPVLDPRPRPGDRVRAAPEGGGRRAAGRSADRHARLLREAAHDRRLEGLHQRPAPRRQLRHQRRPGARAPAAARADARSACRPAPSSSTC